MQSIFYAIPTAACKFFSTSAELPWQQAKPLFCSLDSSSDVSKFFVLSICSSVFSALEGSLFSASSETGSSLGVLSTVVTSPSSSIVSCLSKIAVANFSTLTTSSGSLSCIVRYNHKTGRGESCFLEKFIFSSISKLRRRLHRLVYSFCHCRIPNLLTSTMGRTSFTCSTISFGALLLRRKSLRAMVVW